jgi:cytochrome P450
MASPGAPAEQFPQLDVATVRAAFASGDAEGWSELHRRHGNTLWLPSGLLLTIDLNIVEAMLMNRLHTETRPALYRHARRFIPGADGLLFQTHPIWKRQLLAVSPVFHKTHLTKVARAVTEAIQRHAAEWARAESVPDLYAAMSRMGADVALRALFGIDGCTKAGRRIAEVLTRYKLATMQHAPHARLDRADATLTNMLGSLAANAMAIMSLARDVRALDRLLVEIEGGALDGCIARLREVSPSRKALVSWVNHLFGAYNAVDYTIVTALVLLEHHPAVRRALEAELEGAAARDPSPEQYTELPTLHNFAREVLRWLRWQTRSCAKWRCRSPSTARHCSLGRKSPLAFGPSTTTTGIGWSRGASTPLVGRVLRLLTHPLPTFHSSRDRANAGADLSPRWSSCRHCESSWDGTQSVYSLRIPGRQLTSFHGSPCPCVPG